MNYNEGSKRTLRFLVWVTTWKKAKLTRIEHGEDQSERREETHFGHALLIYEAHETIGQKYVKLGKESGQG